MNLASKIYNGVDKFFFFVKYLKFTCVCFINVYTGLIKSSTYSVHSVENILKYW